MAHFAKINENNIVETVVVVDNSQEHRGHDFLAEDLGLGGRWIQTSYNHNFRNRFAGAGMIYDETNDVFYPQQPYPSWTQNENYDWVSPIEKPTEKGSWNWDEENQTWVDGIKL